MFGNNWSNMNEMKLVLALLQASEVADMPEFEVDFIEAHDWTERHLTKMYEVDLHIDMLDDYWFTYEFVISGEFELDSMGRATHVDIMSEVDCHKLYFHHPDGRYNLLGNEEFETEAQKKLNL